MSRPPYYDEPDEPESVPAYYAPDVQWWDAG